MTGVHKYEAIVLDQHFGSLKHGLCVQTTLLPSPVVRRKLKLFKRIRNPPIFLVAEDRLVTCGTTCNLFLRHKSFFRIVITLSTEISGDVLPSNKSLCPLTSIRLAFDPVRGHAKSMLLQTGPFLSPPPLSNFT